MTGKGKTLVILTPAFPADESPVYLVLSQQLMVKALKKNFPDLHIIVLSFLFPLTAVTYEWYGAEVISFGGMEHRKFRRIILWQRIWRTLKKIRRDHPLSGLLSFWCGECALIGKYFGKRHSLKHISWICGQDARKKNKWVRFIRPQPETLAAMSPFLVREFHRNHGIKPAFLVPNAIDPGLFSPAGPAERDIDILGVGSLEPLKQYTLFTQVVGRLKETFPAIRVFHSGDGRERDRIDQLIKQYQLENNFRLLGSTAHSEVLQLMHRAKIFLHTSEYEGCSTVCLEALYAGAQVVSFSYPFDDPVPYWHVVKNSGEMITTLLSLLQSKETGHSSILTHTMDESARQIMKLFETGPDSLNPPE